MGGNQVFLICGVSGSGKTWVCKQLTDKFTYYPHDEYYDKNLPLAMKKGPKDKPLITESPFGERLLKEDLEKNGFTVHPYFVIEPTDVVRKRYYDREKKHLQQAAITRTKTIVNRANEWNSPRGTSEEVLQMLKEKV